MTAQSERALIGGDNTQQLTDREPQASEGFRVSFIDPKRFRTYIFSPKTNELSYAEQQAGLREITLGKYKLDGVICECLKFSLILHENEGPIPRAIFRAVAKPTQSAKIFSVEEIISAFACDNSHMIPYSNHTGHIVQNTIERDIHPLVLLDIAEEHTQGLTLSLLEADSYIDALNHNRAINSKADPENGHFPFSVGIFTDDDESVARDLDFYGTAISAVITALYKAKGMAAPEMNIEIEPPPLLDTNQRVSMDDVVGHEEAKRNLKAVASAEKTGLTLPKKKLILLEGPPGTGKNTLAEATANEMGAQMLILNTQALPANASPTDRINLFQAAYAEATALALRTKSHRAVLCLDGLASLLGRDGETHELFRDIMDMWSNDTNGHVLVIGITNRPEGIFESVLSRFIRYEIFPPKNPAEVEGILAVLTRRLSQQTGRENAFGNVDFSAIARVLYDVSPTGRDILEYLSSVYLLRQAEFSENGHWTAIDTNFMLEHIPKPRIKKLGFSTNK